MIEELVLPDRIELSTSPLPMECFDPEKPFILQAFQFFIKIACQQRATIKDQNPLSAVLWRCNSPLFNELAITGNLGFEG